MDKFGIFNLLTSLIDVYEKANNQNSPDVKGNTDILSDILKKTENSEKDVKKNTNPETKHNSHLNRQMYDAIIQHDEIIKRVYKNNPPKI